MRKSFAHLQNAAFVLVLSFAPPLAAQTTLYSFRGNAAFDRFGHDVSGAGDVNADGYDDIIVGAVFGHLGAAARGSASVLSGSNGAELYRFYGNSGQDYFGWSVSGAGDVDADGHDDVIVGAPGDAPNGAQSGSARVFSGYDGSVLYTFLGGHVGDFLGGAVAGAGDVNRDGHDDFLVGAQHDASNGSSAGTAWLYSGRDGSIIHRFVGEAAFEYLGSSVASAGDVDADGTLDIIVGAYAADFGGIEVGAAKVYSGRTGGILYRFFGTTEWGRYGKSVDGAGDVNADGFADLIVGHPDRGPGDVGGVDVFSGKEGELLYTYTGESPFDSMGWAVSGAGDVDQDGFDDFMFGVHDDEVDGLVDAGTARLHSGRNGARLYLFEGHIWGGYFGVSVCGAGDVNGDGFPDVVVGQDCDDFNGDCSGSAYVYSPKVLLPPSPGIANAVNDFVLHGGSPGAWIRFVYGFQEGITGVPGCPGLEVLIASPKVAGTAQADASGVATLSRLVPAGASGRTVLLQAVEGGNCTVSNRVSCTFP